MTGREYDHLRIHQARFVAQIIFSRPPNNFLDLAMLTEIRDALFLLDEDPAVRAIVIASSGKHFCAGADLSSGDLKEVQAGGKNQPGAFYKMAVDLYRTRKPLVVAIQGGAIGAGLGLALAGDFRLACPEARFAANFVKLGIHPGFGLSATLPRLIGVQRASLLLLTGRRVSGEEGLPFGLVDMLVPKAELLPKAVALAEEIAEGAPLAVQSTRATARRGLVDLVERATERETVEQDWLARTQDFQIGIAASTSREKPTFLGR